MLAGGRGQPLRVKKVLFPIVLALAATLLLAPGAQAGNYTTLQCPGGAAGTASDGDSEPVGSGAGTTRFSCDSRGFFLTDVTSKGSKGNGRSLSFRVPDGAAILKVETIYSAGTETTWLPEFIGYRNGAVFERFPLARGAFKTFSYAPYQPLGRVEFRYTCNANSCPEANSNLYVGPSLRITFADSTAPAVVGTFDAVPKENRIWSLYEIAADAATSTKPVGACLQNPAFSTCPQFTDGPRMTQVAGQKYAVIRGSSSGAPIWIRSYAVDNGSGIVNFSQLINLQQAQTNFKANCPEINSAIYNGSFPYRLSPCDISAVVTAASNNTTPGQNNWREGSNTMGLVVSDFCNTQNCVPNVTSLGASIIVDNTAPRIADPVCQATEGDNGWLRGPTKPVCSIVATDDNPNAKPQPNYVAGLLAYSWYRDRGATCTNANQPCVTTDLGFTIADEGETTIRTRALDRIGNIASVYKVNTIKYDSSGPSIENPGWFSDGAALSGAVPLVQKVRDTVSKVTESRIEIRRGAEPWQTLNLRQWDTPVQASEYEVSFNTTLFPVGYGYEARISTRDAAGNVSVSPAVSFEIVASPPIPDAPTIAAIKTPTNQTSVSVSWTGAEAGGSYQCRLDSGTYSACVSPKSYTGLSDGQHTVYVRQLDDSGNIGVTASKTWVVDTISPPAPTIAAIASPTTSTSVLVSWTGAEAGGSYQCKLDGGTYAACVSPESYSGLGQGSHTVYVRQIDAAGNIGAAASKTWIVKKSGPPSPPVDTVLRVTTNKYSVAKGRLVTFRFWTRNGTKDKMWIFVKGRRVAKKTVSPKARTWKWRARRAGKTKFIFRPNKGPARTIRIRVLR